jgi:hypothetical protein
MATDKYKERQIKSKRDEGLDLEEDGIVTELGITEVKAETL